MIGKKRIKEITDSAMKFTKADQIEVSIYNQDQALTRFANNHIHQNVNESNSRFSVSVAFGKKIGHASTNSLDLHRIKETVTWAEQIAQFQMENKNFAGFPEAKKTAYRKIETFNRKTARFSHGARARAVAEIVDCARRHALTAFGSVSNGFAEICIANSHGTHAYAVCNDIFCNIVMSGENSTGYAQAGGRKSDAIDYGKLAESAARKAIMSADPVRLPAGKYTTIFEPLAASEFFDYLGDYVFNGKTYEEGRSFVSGKLGKTIVDRRISIIDDPFAKKGFAFPFDFEGVPKKKLLLVDKGIARNVVYDSLTAAGVRKKTTGHGLGFPNPFGPVPMHLNVKKGTKTYKQLIQETQRGLLVTRFHYTNVIDPHKVTFTGMTRDGTFLIENGTIAKGVLNLRFTENIIGCLNRLVDMGNKCELVAAEPGYGSRFATGTIVPSLKIEDFNFTGTTEF
jgi:predicted Zn-dependent protease